MFTHLPLGIAIETLEPGGTAHAVGVDAATRLQHLLALTRASATGVDNSPGFELVQLDATRPGLRARELDRSARRDVASMLRRAEAGFAGLDLWVPPEHFQQAETVDKAVAAMLGAIELSADLARLAALLGGVKGAQRPNLCVTLPMPIDPGVLTTIAAAADKAGVSVADFGQRTLDRLRAAQPPSSTDAAPVAPAQDDAIRVGIDPAALMLAGIDPSAAALKAGKAMGVARLTDVAKTPDKRRVVPGEGTLDLLAFRVALTTSGYAGPVIVDLAGVTNPKSAARGIAQTWSEPLLG